MNDFVKIVYRLGFAAALLATLFSTQAASSQDNAKPPANITPTHQILVTGCLKRGNQSGTYVITDQNGTTWELVTGNADVDLSKHIFHAVSIAGKEVPTQPPHSSSQDAQASNPLHELRVFSLQVLSRSCTR